MKTIFVKTLRGILRGLVFGALLLPRPALAIPNLQLDVLGGVYDPGTETIVTQSDVFTLYAYLTPTKNASDAYIQGIPSQEYFLSITLTPSDGPTGADLGSFTLNGTSYQATQDMAYGVPPTGGLQYSFNFNLADTATPYNTQDSTGQGPDTSGTGMFFVPFIFDVSGLTSGNELHFDLYNTRVKSNGGITVGDFAPFSHDAGTVPVPEPSTLILIGSGLLGLAFMRRKK